MFIKVYIVNLITLITFSIFCNTNVIQFVIHNDKNIYNAKLYAIFFSPCLYFLNNHAYVGITISYEQSLFTNGWPNVNHMGLMGRVLIFRHIDLCLHVWIQWISSEIQNLADSSLDRLINVVTGLYTLLKFSTSCDNL